MLDYSDVMATMPARTSKLTAHLANKEWKEAEELAFKIEQDMARLVMWIIAKEHNL